MPVRGILQLQLIDAALGDEDRQPHGAAALGGALDCVRRQDRQGVRRTWSSTPNTHEQLEFTARIIFVNGSALNSTLVLLNSTSSRFPTGSATTAGCSAST